MKESILSTDSKCIFRETFQSEEVVRANGGTPTAVTFANGQASFNGTSNYINYKIPLQGIYSVRFRLNYTGSAYKKLFDFRGTNNNGTGYIQINNTNIVAPSSGTSYVNGVATTTVIASSNIEIVVTGINIISGTGTNINTVGVVFNLSGDWYSGTMELVEIYKGTLTATEIKNLYEQKQNKTLPPKTSSWSEILRVDARNGVISNKYTNSPVNIIGNSYTFKGFVTDSWTIRSGGSIDSETTISGEGAYKTGALPKVTVGTKYLISIDSDNYSNLEEVYSTTSSSYWSENIITSNFRGFVITVSNTSAGGIVLNTKGSFTVRSITITEIIPSVTPTAVSVVRSGNVYAMDFNGTTSKIDCGSYNTLVGDKTFVAWIKPRSRGEGNNGAVFHNGRVWLYIGSAGSYYGITSDNSTFLNSGNNAFAFGTWSLWIVTRTATGITNFYYNGASSGTTNQAGGTPLVGTTNLTIGNASAQNYTWDGTISNARIIDGILSTQEIAQIFSSEKSQYGL